jgi:hypothetical protein
MRKEEENKKDVHHPAPLHGIFVRGKKLGSNFFVLLFRHSYSTIYASTVTRPLGLVTLTPRALALAMMSTRLREETAEAILFQFISMGLLLFSDGHNVLSGVGAVVHEQQLNVLGVVDEESLVAGGHHVLGLLVATITDLIHEISALEFAKDRPQRFQICLVEMIRI